ncbi:MAG: hypothetical protein E6G41_11255, partial [Actinobacteria bacterium]
MSSGPFLLSPGVLSTPTISLPNSAATVTWPWYVPSAACSPRERPTTMSSLSACPVVSPEYGRLASGLVSTTATLPWPCGLVPWAGGVVAGSE